MAPADLDDLYGHCRPGQRHYWEVGRDNLQCHELDQSTAEWLITFLISAVSNPILLRVTADLTFLWVLDEQASVRFCLEECYFSDVPTTAYLRPRNGPRALAKVHGLGHPLLAGDEGARIAGELYIDMGSNGLTWVLSNQSGRFGYDRTEAQLRNVAQLFANFGVTVDIDYRG